MRIENEAMQDYIADKVLSLTWETVSDEVWEAIEDEGLDEEKEVYSQRKWESASYPVSEADARAMRELSDSVVSKFNRFDIDLKAAFGGSIIDLIDFEKGTVTLVRVKANNGF